MHLHTNTFDETQIEEACERVQNYLLAQQSTGGSWPGDTDLGPQTTAETLIALATYDALEPDLTAQAVAYLGGQQLPDGSFPPYAGATAGTLEQTAVVYAALICVGVSPTNPVALRAWQSIRACGGFAQCPLLAQLWLAIAGVIDPHNLPSIPVSWILVPGIEHQIGRIFSPAFTLMSMVLPTLIRGLKHRQDPPRGGFFGDLRRKREHERLLTYLADHQNPTGNWFGAANFTALILICFHLLGVSAQDPRAQRGLDDLKGACVRRPDTLRWIPFDAQIWSTAVIARVLCESGIPGKTPQIARALRYLLSRQSNWPQPRDWQIPARDSPRIGGWPFGDANPLACDCDTTGKVLHTLAAHRELDPGIAQAITEGRAWLMGMQHRNGGWAAFRRMGGQKHPGPFALAPFTPPKGLREALAMIRHPPVQLDDPATADITGRVLQALGALGADRHDPEIKRAVTFVLQQQYSNDLWWGRWETNFLPSSAEVLSGLAAVGVTAKNKQVACAIKKIFSCQNVDGGWGESVDSYDNLALAGCGESSAYVTGIVLRALVDLDQHNTPAASRAVTYLLKQQRQDGSWPDGNYQFTLQWPWPFYRLGLTSEQYPLLALTRYRQRVNKPA
ncbi:MAG: hypothetical protein ACPG4T_08225 [Nannocystaceae bacterium]